MICIASQVHNTRKTQCLHRLCDGIGPTLPHTHSKWGAAVRIWGVATEARFSTNRTNILRNLMMFIKLYKSMPAIVIVTASRGHKTWKTQCLHRLCVEIGPPMPQTYFKVRHCRPDLMFCAGRHLFQKSSNKFTESDGFSWTFVKSIPTNVISFAPRSHKTWKTQRLHRLCVEIGPHMPKTYFKMRRCCPDLFLMFRVHFLMKPMENFRNSDDLS